MITLLLAACTTNENTTIVSFEACCDVGATSDSAATSDTGTASDTGDASTNGDPWAPPPLDGTVTADPDCQATPNPVALDPELLWAWPDAGSSDPQVQVSVTPVVAPLFDTDGDGLVTAADTPQVVFTSYQSTAGNAPGTLRVLDGVTGEATTTVTSFVTATGASESILGRGGVALGDLDGVLGDGQPEVCLSGYPSALVCFTATHDDEGAPTLTYRWSAEWPASTPDGATLQYGYPAIADFNGDGTAEVALGNHVWSADGDLLYAPAYDAPCPAPGLPDVHWGGPVGDYGVSIPYEVDGDAALELAVGGGSFDIDAAGSTGGLAWCQRFAGYPAIADVDGDGRPDMAAMNYHFLFMTVAATGAVTAGWPASVLTYDNNPSAGPSSPPVFADMNGDGRPELAITGKPSGSTVPVVALYDHDANEIFRWDDHEGWGMTGFDFEGDGLTELIVSGGDELYVLGLVDGAWVNRLDEATTGWDPRLHQGYGQRSANVTVANVDGVGGAELVVPNAIPAGLDPDEPAVRGIVVLRSGSDAWTPARPVWNQHAYSITNVNDDATIPASPVSNTSVYNTFRVADSAGLPSVYQPNVGIAEPVFDPADCDAGTVTLYVAVSNGGANVATNVEVRAVSDAGATVSAMVPSLAAGASTYVTLTIDALTWGNGLSVVVDPDDTVAECDDAAGNVSFDLGPWPCNGR